MKTKTDKIIIGIFGALALIGFSLLIIFFVPIFNNPYSYEDHYLYVNHIEHEGAVYALFEDGSFTNCGGPGDPSWQVYKIHKNINPHELKIPCDVDVIDLGEKQAGVELILSNYSEDGTDVFRAKIQIINDKHLVFKRGGSYYGLYDLQEDRAIVNVWNPWGRYKDYKERKEKIHNRIKELIQ